MFPYPKGITECQRARLTKTKYRKTHLKYFGTAVLIGVMRPITRFWPFHPHSVSRWMCQMSDYNLHNSLHNREFDSVSYEKWLQLFRLMAHISLYNGWVCMPAAPQQGVKNYHKFLESCKVDNHKKTAGTCTCDVKWANLYFYSDSFHLTSSAWNFSETRLFEKSLYISVVCSCF